MGNIGNIYYKDEDDDKKKKTPSQIAGQENKASGQIGSIGYSETYKPIYPQERKQELETSPFPVQQQQQPEQQPVEEKKKSKLSEILDSLSNAVKTIQSEGIAKLSSIDTDTQKSIKKEGALLVDLVELSPLQKRELEVKKKAGLEATSKKVTEKELLIKKRDNPIEYLVNRPYAKTDEGYLQGDVDRTVLEAMEYKLKASADFYNSLSKEDKVRVVAPDFTDEDTYFNVSIMADDTITRLESEIKALDMTIASASGSDKKQAENRKEELENYIAGLRMVKKGLYENKGVIDAFVDIAVKENIPFLGDGFTAEEQIALTKAYGKRDRGVALSDREKMLIEEDEIGKTIEYLTNNYDIGYEITTGLLQTAKMGLEFWLTGKLWTKLGLGVGSIAIGSKATGTVAKGAGAVATGVARTAARAGQVTVTAGMGRIVTEAVERQTPVYQYYWQTGESVKTKEGESPADAWTKAVALEYGNNVIEVMFDGMGNADDIAKNFMRQSGIQEFPQEFSEEILQKFWDEAVINSKQVVLPKDYVDPETQFTFTPRELVTIGAVTLIAGTTSSLVGSGNMSNTEAELVMEQTQPKIQNIYNKANNRTQEELKKQLEEEKKNNPVEGSDYDGVIEEVGTQVSTREIEEDITKAEEEIGKEEVTLEQAQTELDQLVQKAEEAKVAWENKAPQDTWQPAAAGYLSETEQTRLQELGGIIERLKDSERGIQTQGDLKEIVQVKRDLRKENIEFDDKATLSDLKKLLAKQPQKVAEGVKKEKVEKIAIKDAQQFVKEKGLDPDSVNIIDSKNFIVENEGGKKALLTEVEIARFKDVKFETLNQGKYTKGERNITDPIEVVLTSNGELRITDGANRFSQAVANQDKTIPAIVVKEDGSVPTQQEVAREKVTKEVVKEKKKEPKKETKKREPKKEEKKETTKKQETKKEEIEGLSGENQKRFTYKGYEFVTTEYTPRATPSPVPLDTSKKVLDLYGQTKDGWTFVENKVGLEAFTDEQLDGFINKYKDRLIKPKAQEVSTDKIKMLEDKAQSEYEKTFDKLTPQQQLKTLMGLEQGERYIKTTQEDILTKLGKGVGTISLSDMGIKTEPLLWGQERDGMYTDGMILLTDKTVANKVVDKFKDQYIKKYAKQNGISVQEAQKQILEKNKSENFPATKDILDSAKANFKLEPIGFYVGETNRQTGSVIFRAENGTLVRLSGKYYSAIKSFYPTAQFYITDESNVKPISFVVGKTRKGIVMPMMMADDTSFTNLVGEEVVKESKRAMKDVAEREKQDRLIERSKEFTREGMMDEMINSIASSIEGNIPIEKMASVNGTIGYLGEGEWKYDNKTGMITVSMVDGRTEKISMKEARDYVQAYLDRRKNKVGDDDDIAFYTTARRRGQRGYDKITSMADIRRNLDILRKDRVRGGKKEYYHSTTGYKLGQILDSKVLKSEERGKTSFADNLDFSTEYGDVVFVTSQINPVKEDSTSRFGIEYVQEGDIPLSKIDRILLKLNTEDGLNTKIKLDLKMSKIAGEIAFDLREMGFEVGYIIDGKEVGEGYFTTDDDQLMLTSTQTTQQETLSAKEDESKGSVSIEQFEQREVTATEQIRIAEEVRTLVDKYAFKIGEKYLPRNVLGIYYQKTKGITVKGLTDLYVASHEIGHAIDNKFNITAKVEARDKVEMELRDAYINLYPTAKQTHAIKKQKLEGFAMAVATYSQRPTSFTQEYPNIVKELFSEGGKYYNPELREYLDDISLIVSKYQSLNDLDRIATRISKDIPVVEQTLFKSKTEATINMIQNDVNIFERWAKEEGTTMTTADYAQVLRFTRQSKYIFENNITTNLSKKGGDVQNSQLKTFMGGLWNYVSKGGQSDTYLAYDPETKNIKKVLDYNWGTLRRDIAQKAMDRQFNSLLVARRVYYDFEYADKLTAEIESVKQELESSQNELIEMYQQKEADRNKREEKALDAEIEGTKVLLAELETKLAEVESVIRNDGWDRRLVTDAYLNNKGMFEKELEMFDKLTAQDLLLLKKIGIISNDKYNELKDNKGYASFKRIIYDEVLGEVEPQEISGNFKLGGKEISSLKKRTGSTKEIIYPLESAMKNHYEIVKKSIGQDAVNTFLTDSTLQLHASNIKQIEWHKGIENQKDVLIRMENGVKKAYAVDPMIKTIVDSYLTPKQADIFQEIQQVHKQLFTMGTTGLYFQFIFTNIPRDAFTYITQTHQVSSIKAVYNLFADTAKAVVMDGKEREYLNRWLAMGGKETTFLKQMENGYDKFSEFMKGEESMLDLLSRVAKEKGEVGMFSASKELFKGLSKKTKAGLSKVMKVVTSTLGLPSQMSEMWFRSVEFVEAKKEGDSDIIAFEKASRVTTPFHHRGSMKFKTDKGEVKSIPDLPRYAPFQKAALQAFSWVGGNFISDPKKRSRTLIMVSLLTMYAVEELLRAWGGADDDDKEQFLDLSAEDMGRFIHMPKKGGGISRVSVAEFAGSITGFINMMILDFILNETDYTAVDYSTVATTALPDQFNFLPTVVDFLSGSKQREFEKWTTSLIPSLGNPILAGLGFKTYPEFAPIESSWQKSKLPADRYNEGTSKLAKWAMNLELPFDKGRLGDAIDLSPLQLDALLTTTFGRSIGYLTGKKGAWDVLSSVNREYYFEYGRRVNQYWDTKEKNDQLYTSMTKGTREYSKEQELEVYRRKALTKDIDKALDEYKVAYDSKDLDEISKTRARVIDLVNRFNENPSTPEMEMYLANPNAKSMEEAMRARALRELSMKDPRDYTKDELADAKALAKEFRQEALLARSDYSYSELLFGISKNDDKVIKIKEVTEGMKEDELKKYLASLKYAGMISNDVIVKLYNEGVINYSVGKWANDLESNRNF